MEDEDKTKEQLIIELADLRRQIAKLKETENSCEIAEETLQHGEQKLKAVVYGSPIPQFVIDQEHKVIFWNKALEEASGIKAEDVVGTKQHWRAFYGEERPCMADLMVDGTMEKIPEWYGGKYGKSKLVTGAYEATDFFPALGKTGKWLYFSAVAIKDLKGDVIGAIEVLEDITEQEIAEAALRDSREELSESYFAQSMITMILSTSLENISLEEFLKKALNMVLAIPWFALEAIGNIQLVEEVPELLVMKAEVTTSGSIRDSAAYMPFGECLCGKAASTQQMQCAADDACYHVCHAGMPSYGHCAVPVLFSGRTLGVLNILVKKGKTVSQKEEGLLHIVADTLAGIIVRKQLEKEKERLHSQLLQAQKMEAVGQLAGGIAHDFNNVLTAIISYASLLKMKMGTNNLFSGYVDHILSSSENAANLIQSLLAFSRKQIMNTAAVDLNQIIRKVDTLLARIIGEDIELKIVLTEGVLIVKADHLQIEQVLMNLANNARDAMTQGGEFTIETEIAVLDTAFIKAQGYGKTGRYALIAVSDTGTGMDERTAERIFDPFFTTKEVGKGTGLGLAMVYGIIKQHEGYINVYSEPGRGTTFKIYMPLISAKVEEVPPEGICQIEGGNETILLAEDNAEVRTSTRAVLEECGYKVIEAVDGEDAISKFIKYKDVIQLVILDVIMPKRNGREVYEEIKKIMPRIKTVFTSGYTADIIHQKGILSEGAGFIYKPTAPDAILTKVREVLDKDTD
jgi:signal transduction histidine kinase/PAS domain-containing protein/ActR/RegA family two-component response regulator